MPQTLVNVAIPVISLSPGRHVSQSKPRAYGDDPLPVRPSEAAPRNAKIVGRVAEETVTYSLELGGVQVNGVRLNEILDYVSPHDLESFENRQFDEEGELLKIVEIEKKAEKEYKERLKRRREREKARLNTEGTLFSESEVDDIKPSGSSEDLAGPPETGRHGRARPTYKHMFRGLEKTRRRRKRDPSTGVLLPLSDDGENAATIYDDAHGVVSQPPIVPDGELPKRRRRKRDPFTGELLPLNPSPSSETESEAQVETKRRRRKRHPITSELMPLGWQYESNSGDKHGTAGIASTVPAIDRLNITQEHDPKRLKLSYGASTGNETRSRMVSKSPERAVPDSLPATRMTLASFLKGNADHADSDSTSDSIISESQLQPSRPSGGPSTDLNKGKGKEPVKSSKPPLRQSQLQLSLTLPAKSTTALKVITIDESEEDEEEEEVGSEDGYEVEKILAHHMSDPRTHPGKPATMLYQVKWIGYDEPTWEPRESFVDMSFVEEYEARVGLR